MKNKRHIPVYLVSLGTDQARRFILKDNFKNYYNSFEHIDAVDGRELQAGEYYKKTLPYFLKYRKIMSPAELGCTLSHIKALKRFLQTGEPYALILEDDVVGNDNDLESIFELAKNLDSESLLLCGAQEGLNKRYQLGKWNPSKKVYKVCDFSYEFVLRTCCYVVTKKSAQKILDYHDGFLNLADKWGEFFRGTCIKIYYKNILMHPEDLSNSHIEADRAEFKNKTLIQKFISKDAPYKIILKSKNEVIRFFLVNIKYQKLK